MKNFLIITNSKKDKNNKITKRIVDHLTGGGAVCHVIDHYEKYWEKPVDVPEDTQCILVIGGDGTILAAARALVGTGIPLLGINRGTLGFLADVKLTELDHALDRLLRDDYRIENRIMLSAEVYKNGTLTDRYIALNDISVNKANRLRTIGLKVMINDAIFDQYHADGVLVCTPTGSTGYNLSAGGPIINPTCKNFVITPVCPHSLTARSVVLAKDDTVTIEVVQIRQGKTEEGMVSYDGRDGTRVHPGDKVVIYRADAVTPFIKIDEVSFVEILKEKMLR